MGSASSMLTQYDIEEVQQHCNHLCGSLRSFYNFQGLFFSSTFDLVLRFFFFG